ncbi:MAG TPA: type II secretion system protein M [Gammaproteobacteria bacterium]|nr:type II secretion system protein M [Gammaproteobacteria bacterium]
MKAWFDSLQPRERLIFLGGVAGVLLITVWFGVMKLHTQTEVLRDSVAAKQRMLVDLMRVGARPAVPSSNQGSNQQTLVVVIDGSAREHGITLSTRRPDGPDGVQVAFSNVPFDMLLEWLVALEKQSSVAVEAASFTTAKQKGIVNGQLTLRRS